jgi:hypothetical protein
VATKHPSVAKKCVSPHTIRHTTATHLLRSGVDINTIRAWLGHLSVATTNVYAEVDLETKAKALANCEVKEDEPKKAWREDKGLMEFLKTLQRPSAAAGPRGRGDEARSAVIRVAGLL